MEVTTKYTTSESYRYSSPKKEEKTATFTDAMANSSDSKQKDDEVLGEHDRTKEMVADLLSLIRTGLTVSELERLQELLAEINELIKEKGNNPDSRKEIDEMLSALEQAVLALKKRLNGEAVIEEEENVDIKEKDTLGFASRIKSVTSSINDLLDGYVEKSDSIDKDDDSNLHGELIRDNSLNFLDSLKMTKDKSMSDEEFNKLTKKLEMKKLSQGDMDLFKSIIEDRRVTKSEIEKRSYEQIESTIKTEIEQNEDDFIL